MTLAVVAVLLVTAAFARVITRTVTSGAFADGEIELTVMHWSGEGGQEEDKIVEDSLAEFEAAHPGVRVKRLNPGDAGSFYTKLQTMMAAGEAPDVFYVGYERVANFASLELLRPIDDFVAREASLRTSGDTNTLDLADFYPQTVDAFRFDGRRVGTGSLYGIPKDFTTVGFYYNKDLFQQAGIAFPSRDWTWDDYIAAARALGQLPGITGSEFVTWPVMVRTYLRTEGCEAIDDGLTNIRVDEPAALSALDRLRAVGLRPTRQRLALARLLFDGCDRHISAEQLHTEALSSNIRVSLATVYNTLHQFTDVGLLREIVVDAGRSYFDTNTSDHHHFFYEKSGKLCDIPAELIAVGKVPDAPEGMRISRVEVIVRVDG
jgi:Fur family iron response transcriptional regulator